MNSGKVFLGILIGATAGVLAGLLIAPEKGSELRDKISDIGEEYLDKVKDRFDDMFDVVTSKMDQIKKDLSHLTEK